MATPELIRDLYRIVDELEALYPGRKFTPDGHLVGSIGEALVAEKYGLTLMPASNKGYDATDADERRIEIKCTGADHFAFRHEAECVIAVVLKRDGSIEEVYNGPGGLVWDLFKHRKLPSNGQHRISVSRLRKLGAVTPSNHEA